MGYTGAVTGNFIWFVFRMNKIVLILALVVVAVGAYWYFDQPAEMIEESPAITDIEVDDAAAEVSDETVVSDDEEVEVISMSATGRVFIVDGEENPTLTVAVGDTVRIDFSVTGGTHDFVIDELGVNTAVLAAGESEMVEFVATEAGTFEYYCSVGNHYAEGMFGTIIVE